MWLLLGIYCSVLEQLCVSKPEQAWGGLRSNPLSGALKTAHSVVPAELISAGAWLLSSSSSAHGGRRLMWQEQTADGSDLALAWSTE